MSKKKITKQDLKDNPELKEQGVKIGDEIEIPDHDQRNGDDLEDNDEDTGGSNPPVNKGRG